MSPTQGDERIQKFSLLLGRTIKEVDASCINVVHITFTDGTRVSIDAEESHHGIPVVRIGE